MTPDTSSSTIDRQQALAIANERYRDQDDLILLAVDTSKLKAPLVYDKTANKDSTYPHIYGPLNTNAVRYTAPLQKIGGIFNIKTTSADT